MKPEQAAQAFTDLDAREFFAMHWGMASAQVGFRSIGPVNPQSSRASTNADLLKVLYSATFRTDTVCPSRFAAKAVASRLTS